MWGKNLSLCFSQLCCGFAGAARVCFGGISCLPSCPVGVVPPCNLIVPCCIFQFSLWFCSPASSPLHLLPSVLRVFLPLSPAPHFCSAQQAPGLPQSPAGRDTSPVPSAHTQRQSCANAFLCLLSLPALFLEARSVFPYTRECEERETRLKAKFPLTSVGAGFHLKCFMFWALDNNMKGLHTCKT